MVGTSTEQVTEADLGRATGQLKGERINSVSGALGVFE